MNSEHRAQPVAPRRMLEADLPRVLAVERAAYPLPWSEDIFRDCLRSGHCCLILEQRGQPIGHGIMLVAAGECHLLNLCVHPDCQRRGLGRLLLRHLLAVAREHGAGTAFLEVRVSNQAAVELYRGESFNEVGTRRGYYPALAGREDAMVMARIL